MNVFLLYVIVLWLCCMLSFSPPQSIGQPISDRFMMHTEIPAAFESYGQAFIHYRKILDLYGKKVWFSISRVCFIHCLHSYITLLILRLMGIFSYV